MRVTSVSHYGWYQTPGGIEPDVIRPPEGSSGRNPVTRQGRNRPRSDPRKGGGGGGPGAGSGGGDFRDLVPTAVVVAVNTRWVGRYLSDYPVSIRRVFSTMNWFSNAASKPNASIIPGTTERR